jgi:hypothetical protein
MVDWSVLPVYELNNLLIWLGFDQYMVNETWVELYIQQIRISSSSYQ